MKEKAGSIFIISVVVVFPLSGPGDNQKPQWNGKIEYENGVKVIKNPREPLYGEDVLILIFVKFNISTLFTTYYFQLGINVA